MDSLIERLREAQGRAKLVGEAPALLRVTAQLPAVARSEATVLITGETGTGKELVARTLHYLSQRASFPFTAVNCGSLPDSLLEDELFGHERGAFTDAQTERRGLVDQADKGTLFLDELETLTLKAQVVLLRFLQDKKFRPVGSGGEQQADVRIIAATNALLDELVRAGNFRADLYYRFDVFTIHLPPLRERKEDILLLASHCLAKHTPPDRGTLQLSPAARKALIAYDWPGNVRELENAIIRGIHVCQAPTIDLVDLGLPSTGDCRGDETSVSSPESHSFRAMKKRVIEDFERNYLIRLMTEHQGNVSHAALAAGKERRDLGKLLKRYQIDPKQCRIATS